MRRAIVCAGVLCWCVACGATPRDEMPNGAPAQAGDGALLPVGGAAGANGLLPTAPSTTNPSDEPDPQQPMNTAGTGAPEEMPMMEDPTPMAEVPQGIAPPEGFRAHAMDECGLNSGWPGDEYCILPPPVDKGFQLHLGPSSYDNPEATYLLEPGEEWVHRLTATSGNAQDIKFYVRQYRMRPGAHHTIVRDTSTGRRLSGSDVNQDHPVDGITAPENAGIGIPLAAHAPLSTDHHAINITEDPLLQEVWVNFWYVDPAKVTETTTLLYDPGSVSETIAPHADVVMGPYECDIQGAGRLISMFGHVHANDVRFSAWRTRAGVRAPIYDSYHWEDPLWLEFTSLAHNPVSDATTEVDGGWTGILDLQAGDTLGWECHEVNQQDTTLYFVNQTYAGWMCIIIGELVGTSCKTRNPGLIFDPTNE